MRSFVGRAIAALGVLWLVGCASAPQTHPERATLIQRSDARLTTMMHRDPSLSNLLAKSAGWAVFPSVGEGGFIVGAQQGVGVVYERGRGPTGFAVLRQGSVGLQAGGRAFAEIVILRTPAALERLRGGRFELTSQAGATILSSGAADAATTQRDVSVFIDEESGAMASLAFGGQMIDYQPMA